jgi:hypothetical protein
MKNKRRNTSVPVSLNLRDMSSFRKTIPPVTSVSEGNSALAPAIACEQQNRAAQTMTPNLTLANNTDLDSITKSYCKEQPENWQLIDVLALITLSSPSR